MQEAIIKSIETVTKQAKVCIKVASQASLDINAAWVFLSSSAKATSYIRIYAALKFD